MKLTKMLGSVVVAAMALMSLAGTASATTLEINGAKKNEAVAIKASLKTGTSSLLITTDGFFVNTCVSSAVEGKTEGSFTGTTVGGKVNLGFGLCTEALVTTDIGGTLTFENIAGTTDATVRSTGTRVTWPSPFGTVNCTTNNTDLGRLTGVASGNATWDVNAVLNCGFFSPSTKWEATYTVTTPTGFGVTS
jgi:hypothetical protein